MKVVHVNTELPFEELLKAVGQLSGEELEKLMREVVSRRARLMAPSFSEKETVLLEKINKGFPQGMRKRFAELDRKRKAEKLSPLEQEELAKLTDKIEDFNAERIGFMAQLARLKGVSMSELVKEFELENS